MGEVTVRKFGALARARRLRGLARLMIVATVAVPAWSSASAQDGEERRVRVGLGAQIRPEWPGSDDHEFTPLVDIDVARGSNPFRFEAPDDSFGFEVLRQGGFSFGPVANFVGSRKNKDVGAPVGKVKSTIEVGGFAQYDISESLRVRGEVRKGLGGHDGRIGQIAADYVWRDGDRFVFSIGPRMSFANARYQRAYFGVTPSVSLVTGLPVYRPDAGALGIAVASGLSYQFSPRFGMFGFARAERLVGDAGKSPIVREFGSRSQLSAGLGLSYTFTLRQ